MANDERGETVTQQDREVLRAYLNALEQQEAVTSQGVLKAYLKVLEQQEVMTFQEVLDAFIRIVQDNTVDAETSALKAMIPQEALEALETFIKDGMIPHAQEVGKRAGKAIPEGRKTIWEVLNMSIGELLYSEITLTPPGFQNALAAMKKTFGHLSTPRLLAQVKKIQKEKGRPLISTKITHQYPVFLAYWQALGIKITQYTSYDIRGSFSRSPENLTVCPLCFGDLSSQSIEASKAAHEWRMQCLIPIAEPSRLFTCRCCHWWYIREYWADAECGPHFGDYEFIIVGAIPSGMSPDRHPSQRQQASWRDALNDETVYYGARSLPGLLQWLFTWSNILDIS